MSEVAITSLKELVHELEMGSGLEGYLGLMHRLKLTKKEVKGLCSWNSKKYTRNLIERNNDYELILMCWEPGQKSLIHSYYDQQGWMYVIEGDLVVNHFFESHGEKKMQFYKEIHVKDGRFLYVNDYLGFHSVMNASKGRTVSLHLHAGPVDKWKVYDPDNNAFFIGKTNYDTQLDLQKE